MKITNNNQLKNKFKVIKKLNLKKLKKSNQSTKKIYELYTNIMFISMMAILNKLI